MIDFRTGAGASSTPVMSATGPVSATVVSTPRASVRVGPVPTSRSSLTVPLRWSWTVRVGSGSTTKRGDRSLALSHGARLIFERLSVWAPLAESPGAVTPIVRVDVSQAGGFGTAMFDLANIASNNQFGEQAEKDLLTRYFERAPDQALLRAFYAMKTASALREAVWGMVSEIHLNAPGVDYVAYAREYLGRYEKVLAEYNSKFGKT